MERWSLVMIWDGESLGPARCNNLKQVLQIIVKETKNRQAHIHKMPLSINITRIK